MERGKLLNLPVSDEDRQKEVIVVMDRLRDLAIRGIFHEINEDTFPNVDIVTVLGFRLDAIYNQISMWSQRKENANQNNSSSGQPFNGGDTGFIVGISNVLDSLREDEAETLERLSDHIDQLVENSLEED